MDIRYNKIWLVSALVMLISCSVLKSQTITFTPFNVTCNGANDAAMQIDVSGIATPYWYVCYDMNYQVNNDSVGPTTAPSYSFTGLIPGRPYIFVVKDAADPDIWLGFSYFVFTQPTALNATLGKTNVTCYGTSTGSISITSSTGGYGTFDYTINGGADWQQTGTFNSLPAGFYNVQMRDRAHPACVKILNANYEITQPAQLNATLTANQPTCYNANNGSIVLSAPSGGTGTGYQYSINGGVSWSASTLGTYTYSSLGPGTYNVVMRDVGALSCTRTLNASVVFTQPNQLAVNVTINKGLTCYEGSDGQLIANVTGGTAPYTYTWYVFSGGWVPIGQTTPIAINLARGRYQVRVNDANSCGPVTAGFFFLEGPAPGFAGDSIPPMYYFDSASVVSTCAGQTNGSISIYSHGGVSPYRYSITTGGAAGYQNPNLFSNLAAGTYQTWAVDDRGCKKQGPNQVVATTPNDPVSVAIAATPSGTFCPGTSISFTATPVNAGTTPAYQWWLNGTNVGTNSPTYTNAALVNGDQVRVVLTSSLRCTSGNPATSNTYTASLLTPPSISGQPASQTLCAGANATFTVTAAGSGLTYQWRKNGTNISGATLASYTLNNITAADAANYSVVVTGTCGNVTSNNAALVVNPLTAITTQPVALTQCAGTNATFTVVAVGTNLTYQWRKNGTNISGATSASYTLTNIAAGDAGNYSVVVSGNCGANVTSNNALLTVNPLTAITTQPVALTQCAGTNATFTVTAVGTNLTYQWRKNGTNISGATLASYTLNNITAADAANYSVVVTGTCGNVTSNNAALVVNPLTAITTQPVALTQCAGTNATFTVVAVGTNLTYQWRKNGTNISGATLASYTLTNIAAGDAGNYSVVVSGDCGANVTSSNALLTVNPLTAITVQPVALTQCAATNATFTVTAVGTNLTYQWRKDGTNIPGATLASYTINNITAASAGNYSVVVTGTCGNVTSNNAALVVNPLTAITTQPVALTQCAGTNATFTVVAVGTNLTYQWRKDGTNIPGATLASYTINNITAANAGNYSVVVSGDCGANVTSNNALLTVNPLTAITAQPVALTQCAGTNATFTVTAVGTNLTYQWRKDGTNIPGATLASYTINNITAASAGNYSVVVSGNCGANVTSNNALLIVNPLTAITTQPVALTQCAGTNATFTVVAVGTNLTYQWRKNGTNISGATLASYTLTNIAAGDAGNYSVVVSGDCGANVTSNNALLTVNPLTAITTQPVALTQCAGTNATFTVVAVGTNLTYQWRKDGTDLSGATLASYTINNITAASAGNYSVVVSGNCGANVTSNNALLTVNPLTAITAQPVALTQCAGTNATFTVTAVGTNLTYQWRKNGTNISGATLASYTLNNITAADAANYSVVVTGTCGNVTSNNAALVVNPLTAITTQPVALTQCAGTNATFTVIAVGTNLTYQWRKDGTDLSGATLASYTINNITAANAGNYSVVVSGNCGANVTSNNALLIVNPLTAITAQPVALTQCAGTNATFTVTAVGTNLTYQWRKNGTNISGATLASYTLNNITAADAANYSVVVTGTCGNVTSNNAALVVNPLTAITTQPVALTQCAGTNATFTVVAVGTNLTYQWRKNGTNISGATLASYTLTNIAAGDAGNYSVVVSGDCGANVTSNNALLTVNPLTAITTQPASLTECEGSNVTFTVIADGSTLQYQWRKDGINIPGANSNAYTLTSITTANEGNYSVVVSGDCGTVTSANASLTVNIVPVITSQPQGITQCAGTDYKFTVVSTGMNIIYTWRKNGIPIIPAETNDTLILAGIDPADAGSYDVVITNACGSTISDAALLIVAENPAITTQPTDKDLCEGGDVSFSVVATGTGISYQWRKDGTNLPGKTGTTLDLTAITLADAGNYDVLVYGMCDTIASNPAVLLVYPATRADIIDSDTIVCKESNVEFNVAASGYGSLIYQWQRFYYGSWVDMGDDAHISGSTTAALTINMADMPDTGLYRVQVQGGCGSVYSEPVRLDVNSLIATIGTPAPFMINSATTTIEVEVEVDDHFLIFDLGFSLVAPDGTEVMLKSPIPDPCVYNSPVDINARFTNKLPSTDTMDYCLASGNITGTFGAAGDWSVLNGMDPSNGAWQVRVYDQDRAVPDPDGYLSLATLKFVDLDSDGDTAIVTYNSGLISEGIMNPLSSELRPTSYVVPIRLMTSCFNSEDAHAIVTVQGGIPPFTFEWTGPTAEPDEPDVMLGAGSYSVLVTDALGCTSIATVEVSAPPSIVFDDVVHTDTLICNGAADGIIRSKASGGAGSFIYTLLPGNMPSAVADSGVFYGLTAGIYTIRATDINGCVLDSVIQIFEHAQLTVQIDLVQVTSPGTGSITLTASGGVAPYRYSIDNGATLQVSGYFPGLDAGFYQVYVVDALGCTYTETVNLSIELLDVYVTKNDVTCGGYADGSFLLALTDPDGVGPYTLTGSFTQPQTVNEGFFSFTGQEIGKYDVRIVDSEGKVFVDTIEINGPAPIVALETITDATCSSGSNDGAIELAVSGGASSVYSFEWSTGATTQDLLGIDAGTYQVTITDETSCVADFDYVVGATTFVSVDAGIDTTICSATEYQLEGEALTPDYDNLLWTPGNVLNDPAIIDPIANITQSTKFYLTIYKNGCSHTDSVTVNIYEPVEFFIYRAENGVGVEPLDTVVYIAEGESVSMFAGNIETMDITGIFTPDTYLDNPLSSYVTATPLADIKYMAIGTTLEGCHEYDSVRIVIRRPIIIYTGFSPNEDGVNDTWEIKNAEGYGDLIHIRVYNRWGEPVFESKGYGVSQEWDGTRNGRPMPVGSYYYIIDVKDGKSEPYTGTVTILR